LLSFVKNILISYVHRSEYLEPVKEWKKTLLEKMVRARMMVVAIPAAVVALAWLLPSALHLWPAAIE
jgi:hypothetical protein